MTWSVVVLGTQWGDEGKGKVVDLLSAQADAVVRFQGGHNAGHTVVVGGRSTILHLLPSGVLHRQARCFLGGGVVLCPPALLKEIAYLEQGGLPVGERLRVSAACTLVLPCHEALDQARESMRGRAALGTTQRGIGPAYEDKVARRAFRLCDLAAPQASWEARLRELLDYYNFQLEQGCRSSVLDVGAVLESVTGWAEALLPWMADVPSELARLRHSGARILFEGAQGVLLDLDHGTYPYVTASNTVAATVAAGAGVPPRSIDYILGITKAYCTRVGAGPFPSEAKGRAGEQLSARGVEFGATTGRPRRCGWLDVAALRRAHQLNGFDGLCVTKLDVLDGMDPLRLCVGYELAGERYEVLPEGAALQARCRPVYEELPGWKRPTRSLCRFADLPSRAVAYLRRVEEFTEVPVTMISTGQDRQDVICLQNPYDTDRPAVAPGVPLERHGGSRHAAPRKSSP